MVRVQADGRHQDDADNAFDDLRPRGIRLSSHLLDLLIIGTFIGAFLGVDFNPLAGS